MQEVIRRGQRRLAELQSIAAYLDRTTGQSHRDHDEIVLRPSSLVATTSAGVGRLSRGGQTDRSPVGPAELGPQSPGGARSFVHRHSFGRSGSARGAAPKSGRHRAASIVSGEAAEEGDQVPAGPGEARPVGGAAPAPPRSAHSSLQRIRALQPLNSWVAAVGGSSDSGNGGAGGSGRDGGSLTPSGVDELERVLERVVGRAVERVVAPLRAELSAQRLQLLVRLGSDGGAGRGSAPPHMDGAGGYDDSAPGPKQAVGFAVRENGAYDERSEQ